MTEDTLLGNSHACGYSTAAQRMCVLIAFDGVHYQENAQLSPDPSSQRVGSGVETIPYQEILQAGQYHHNPPSFDIQWRIPDRHRCGDETPVNFMEQ